ncbi:hypothetical protein SJ221_01575 [Enterobacter kobei]|uniref:hypothetical protein n=1 Tax=Enterobacter kobei TaxID=208224 RepID=UPI001FCF9395|nr:hypothetical protein [Enterobacter kobei]MDX6961369.1 hypothetical protein [Enterobacter kobei]
MMLAGELEPLKERTWTIELELARIALASLEAEPVCVIDQSNLDYLKSGSDADVWPASRTEMGDMVLYRAAPPAPVLPRDLEEIIFTIVNAMADEKLRNDESELFSLAKKYIEHAKSKLGAAMLQDAEPVSQRYKLRDAVETIRNSGIVIDADKIFAERDALNSPVIPDGWVMVPVDMSPEMMRAVQINSELGAYSATNLTGAYSLFREFWDVAIAAAPQQEYE